MDNAVFVGEALALLRLTYPRLSCIDVSSTEIPANIVKHFVEACLPLEFDIPAREEGVSDPVQIETLVLDNCPNIKQETLSWLRSESSC